MMAISQSSRYAVFATLMVTFDNGVVPNVSASWLRYPSATRAGQIQVMKNGTPTVVYFALPDLTPVAGAAAEPPSPGGVSRSLSALPPSAPAPFAWLNLIKHDTSDLFDAQSSS